MVDLTKYSVGRIVGRAFRQAGVFAPDEEIPIIDYVEGLTLFGEMMDEWALNQLTVYAVVPRTLKLKPGKSSYTYGTGGDWPHPRPIHIEPNAHVNLGYKSVMAKVLDYSMTGWAYENYWSRPTASDPHPVIWVQSGYPMLKIFTASHWDSITLFVKEPLAVESFGDIERADVDVLKSDPREDTPKSDVQASNLKLNRQLEVQLPPGYISTMIACLAVKILPNYPLQRGQLEASLLVNKADKLYYELKISNHKVVRIADPRAPTPCRTETPAGGPLDPVVDPPPEDRCKAIRWNGRAINFNSRRICWNKVGRPKEGLSFNGNKITFNSQRLKFN